MNLQTMLGETSKQAFVRDYFQRMPFSLSTNDRQLSELADWTVCDQLLRQPGLDLMVVRRGEKLETSLPMTGEEARALLADGYTFRIRHAEQHHPPLKDLAEAFERDFRASVNVHLYATPPNQQGLSWHYDAEDVFILQTAGAKEYSLRKNTVHPWPLEETIPLDMRYGREIMPLMRVLLKAGDWLYIPCGYWHRTECPPGDEPALSIALGLMTPAAISILDRLRPRLVDSLVWRQRLPVCGEAAAYSREELLEQHREVVKQIVKDLQSAIADETFLKQLVDGP